VSGKCIVDRLAYDLFGPAVCDRNGCLVGLDLNVKVAVVIGQDQFACRICGLQCDGKKFLHMGFGYHIFDLICSSGEH
jgi:hypothetical protein